MAALVDAGFWRGKRVFITGQTGFIGGWLYFWLNRLGAELHGYALAPIENGIYQAANLQKTGTHSIADLRDADGLKKSLLNFRPDIVLHLAAQALVRPAFYAPADTFSTNVTGTVNLLEAMRECESLQAAMIFTTDKVYENIEQRRGYLESDRLGGYEPYGASKACAEIVTQSYWHSYFKKRGVPFCTLRAGNVIGGGDWSADRLVPDAIRAFTANKDLVLRHPEAVRPWQHVLEPCLAILQMLQKTKMGLQHYNIGPDAKDCQNVGWIADHLVSEWQAQTGGKSAWRHEPDQSIYEAQLLLLDNARAKKQLGWQPRWTTEQAIRHTAAWYAAQNKRQNMAEFSAKQIEEFTA